MPFHLYQVAIAVIAVFMIYQGVDNFVKGKNHPTILKLLVRIVVWGGMAVVAIFPNVTVLLAKVIGIEGNLNAVILTAFILVFLMIFKLLSAIERVESQLSDVVRNEALKDLKKK